MDFGLARTFEGDGMTQTGALVGTMEYMSPEQALAKELDQRSDLFALGLILYELLTGKTPFAADSVVASLIKRTRSERFRFPITIDDSECAEQHRQQVPGARSRAPLPECNEMLRDLEAWQGNRARRNVGLSAGR